MLSHTHKALLSANFPNSNKWNRRDLWVYGVFQKTINDQAIFV